MTVRCRYCKESLELNEDSLEARKQGTDPLQQMRQHIATHTMLDVMTHGRKMGWLIDALTFESPHEPTQWRRHLEKLLDYCQTEEAIR